MTSGRGKALDYTYFYGYQGVTLRANERLSTFKGYLRNTYINARHA